MAARFISSRMRFISGNPWEDVSSPVRITFEQTVAMPEFLSGTLTRLKECGIIIESESKVQGGIAPGQFAAIYDASSRLCYGSGIITGQNVII